MAAATGRCLCGAVRYEVDGPMRDVWYCHCGDCKRVTGHHMAATSAAAASVTIDPDATLRWYSAQPGVRYGFCEVCGSSLFWKADDKADRLSICAGTLDQPSGLTTSGVLFDAEKADYVVTAPEVETFSGDSP